ncbi:MAG TPA: DUF2238 domain-containing protein [Tepidisphaeraceae bacterium]|nr:DUF2238 domain-containing protein [Tepidisphaeraceae bacterium]
MKLPMPIVGAAATAGVVALAVAARSGSNYKWAPLFLIPLVWAPYLLRSWMRLHPLHYLLFVIAVLLHSLGALGFYQRGFFGVSFDVYVHFYFGLVGALLVHRFVRETTALTAWQLRVGVVLLVLGMGAIHEMVEWASTLKLGEEYGMLKTKGVYQFDTQRDMFSNLVGATLAEALYAVVGRRRRLRAPSAERVRAATADRAAA